MGPFRGRSRVIHAVALLQRSYPLRQCVSSRTGPYCLYGQTGRCLSPCRGDEQRDAHDRLVLDVLGWVTGGAPPADGDPLDRGHQVMEELSRQRRYEEAQTAREALDHLAHLRRAYAALEKARDLRTAVLWPAQGDSATVRLNLVWQGKLVAAQTVTRATAPLEVGRLLRSLSHGDGGRGPITVAQDELDRLLAVRRWFLEHPGAPAIACPTEGGSGERIEAWRRSITEELERLLTT